MFQSLNEMIGWPGAGIESFLAPKQTILLGDSNPLDTLPFLLSFMNNWLKSGNTAVVFVSFKTSQNRLVSVFRKLFGLQLNLLTAQSRFAFVDAVVSCSEEAALANELRDKTARMSGMRVLVILEGFSLSLIGNNSMKRMISIFSIVEKAFEKFSSNLVIQWTRDVEVDYPARSSQIQENVKFGGSGWLYLLSKSHFVFCARPLRSGMTKDATGQLVACRGLAGQGTSDQSAMTPFHPTTVLYRIPTDTTIQCFTRV